MVFKATALPLTVTATSLAFFQFLRHPMYLSIQSFLAQHPCSPGVFILMGEGRGGNMEGEDNIDKKAREERSPLCVGSSLYIILWFL